MRSAAASPKSPKCAHAHGSLTPNHGIRGTDAYLLVWLLQLTLPENTSGVVLRVCKCAMELTGGSQRSKCTRHDRHCLQRAGQRPDSSKARTERRSRTIKRIPPTRTVGDVVLECCSGDVQHALSTSACLLPLGKEELLAEACRIVIFVFSCWKHSCKTPSGVVPSLSFFKNMMLARGRQTLELHCRKRRTHGPRCRKHRVENSAMRNEQFSECREQQSGEQRAQSSAHRAARTEQRAQRTAHSAQRTAHSAQRTAHSAQRAASSEQRSEQRREQRSKQRSEQRSEQIRAEWSREWSTQQSAASRPKGCQQPSGDGLPGSASARAEPRYRRPFLT